MKNIVKIFDSRYCLVKATMSNCQSNKQPIELLVPRTRSASQIQNRQRTPQKRHLRNGGGVPQPSKIVSALRALGIQPCQTFPDYNCIKQVHAQFVIEPGTNDEGCCQKCPPPPPPQECGFPLPSPSPCCPEKKCCCDHPQPPPPPHCKCIPICGKLKKLEFNDPCPCDDPSCTWTIKPDECGSESLLFQCCGEDKALLDCDGNLNLAGKLEATGLCLAPIEQTPEQQWCFETNPVSGALQLNNIDRENPQPSDQVLPQTISFTKAGAIVESAIDVTFTPFDPFFSFNSNALPATIIVHNASLLPNKQIKINAGVYNGQKVTIVNVDNAVLQVEFDGNPKNVAAETLIIASWSSLVSKWTASS